MSVNDPNDVWSTFQRMPTPPAPRDPIDEFVPAPPPRGSTTTVLPEEYFPPAQPIDPPLQNTQLGNNLEVELWELKHLCKEQRDTIRIQGDVCIEQDLRIIQLREKMKNESIKFEEFMNYLETLEKHLEHGGAFRWIEFFRGLFAGLLLATLVVWAISAHTP